MKIKSSFSYGVLLSLFQFINGQIVETIKPATITFLYAPWRTAHKNPLTPKHDCIFCAKFAKHDYDSEMIIKQYRYHSVMMNVYPYNVGHMLVVPHEHVKYIDLLDKEAQHELIEIVAFCVEVVKKLFKAGGVNVGLNMGRCAGASVPDHAHVHVVPRFDGDTSFFPVTAQTAVYSFDLVKIFEQLKKYFNENSIN